jgi:hypothetical protein
MRNLPPLSRLDAATETQRRAILRSPELKTETARILGLDPGRVRLAIDALLTAGIVPHDGDDASVVNSKDSAYLLAAFSCPHSDDASIISASEKALSMNFECDYGSNASEDRREARASDGRSEKDTFGTQLAAVIREVCDRDAKAAGWGLAYDGPEAGIMIGWTWEGNPIGSVHFDFEGGDVSFLYAGGRIFPELHPGVTVKRLNFEFEDRIDIPPLALRRFARLMRDLGDVWDEERVRNDPDFFGARRAMHREGWGIFDAGNGRQTIQKLADDPVGRRFSTDREAVDHVMSMAAIRSPLHARAMRLHYTELQREDDRRLPEVQPGRRRTSDGENV